MLQTIKLSEIKISDTNTKGRTQGAAFDDLVSSVREKGVLVPILVRPVIGSKQFKFELVAGERRFEASKKATKEEIPANVVEMTDSEAREAQIVENLQRQDIHPLDEGRAYRELVEASRQDIEAVAAKVGKTVNYVRDRLLLTNLIPKAIKAFKDGKIHAGHAALVARLSDKMQREALEWLTQWGDHTTSDLREWIQNHSFADMANAPWKDDEKLREALGGCEECKGKGGDLFGKKAADACTNPKCFAQRLAAFVQIKLKEDPELVKVSSSYGRSEKDAPLSRSEYTAIESKKDACDTEKKGIIVEGDGIGRIIRFCNDPGCKKHNAQHSDTPYKLSDKEKATRKTEKLKEKRKEESNIKSFQAAIKKIKATLPPKHIDALFEFTITSFGFSQRQPLVKLMGLEPIVKKQKITNVKDYEATLRKYAEENGNDGKMRVIFGLIMPHPSTYDTTSFTKAIKKI